MIQTTVVDTSIPQSDRAGTSLGLQMRETLDDSPDVVIAFIAPTYEQADVLKAIKKACSPKLLVGCTSSGEFIGRIAGNGMACAAAIRSDDMLFSAVVGLGLKHGIAGAARRIASSFQGLVRQDFRYRSGLVLVDGLQAPPERLVEQLTLFTDGAYQFFGCGAGDSYDFSHASVFYGEDILSDAAVVLEILSNKPIGIGSYLGWAPISKPMEVTEARGQVLVSINGRPSIEAVFKYAESSGQVFDLKNPVPFFLYNTIGVDTGCGHQMRGVIRVNPDGSLFCCSDIPVGSAIQFMNARDGDMITAAEQATRSALHHLYGSKPAMTFFFDCPTTRYGLGSDFSCLLDTVQQVISETPYIGCNTYCQIARTQGQFNSYLNCKPLVCIIPE